MGRYTGISYTEHISTIIRVPTPPGNAMQMSGASDPMITLRLYPADLP